MPDKEKGSIPSPQSTLIEEMLPPIFGDEAASVMVAVIPVVLVPGAETVTEGGRPNTCTVRVSVRRIVTVKIATVKILLDFI